MKEGVKPKKEVIYKNISMTKEQFIVLNEEAKELYDGNLSMHLRNIFDQYIHKRGVLQEMRYN